MTIQNQKPIEPIVSSEIGYTIVKQRFNSELDYDLSKLGGWSRLSSADPNTAVYTEQDYDRDNRIFTWSNLAYNEEHVITLSFLDDFILGSAPLIQAQYLQAENVLDLKHTTLTTKDPITITAIDNVVTSTAVANPFSDLVFTYTGVADKLLIQARKVGDEEWVTIYEAAPVEGMKATLAGGTYEIRHVSTIGFSDNTTEDFPVKTFPTTVEVDSGLSAPVAVTNVGLAAYTISGSSTTYDLRVFWDYPLDEASQNKKRNFIVTALPNPTLSTDYAALGWGGASDQIAVTSPYSIKPFPYKTPYVIRVGVAGWGTESSDYVYIPVFLSKDTGDSTNLGYLVPSDSEAPVSTKIQVTDEHIRAYSVFSPSNPSLNKIMFELDAATGNVTIGRAGGAYNNTSITTAPFIFDSVNNKLQVSGRVITDQIESASYVLTWIDAETPSLRTAGKEGYGSNAPGVWMGYTDLSTFKFDLGNATNYMRWDGSNLTISGTVRIGEEGRTIGQAQKQVFIYKRSSTGTPPTPTGGSYQSPAPAGWSLTVPAGSDELYMSSRLLTSDAMPPQEPSWATPSLFQPGSTGTPTFYMWIKYADTATGSGLSDDPTGKDYIGIASNKTSATESTDPADYTWSRLTGTPGIPGTPGSDGQTLYTWIKYSANANGNPMTDSPNASTAYIGVSPNQTTEVEGTDHTQYTWSRFKGDQGVAGVNNFKSTVFIRQDSAPSTPTGGTYSSPIPTSGGWSDGIPPGNATLWAATRIFAADNLSPPHQLSWSTPVAMTSTAELEIKYSTVLNNPGDPTSSPANWSSAASVSTIWMAQRIRTNNTWSSWNISKVKGETGAPGADGSDGRVFTLSASTQTITFNAFDIMTPAGQSVTFTVSRTPNITGSTVWSAIDDSGNVVSISGTNTSATLDGALLSSRKSIRVTAVADGLSDTISVAKIKDGADSLVAFLTNESHGVPASKDGIVSSFVGADGYMKVYRGTTDITASCTFSVAVSNGATGTISTTGYYSITAMSADVGTLTLRAIVSPSGSVLDKVFTITKVKAGVVGARGAGQYSTNYTNPVKPITSGMAAAAKAACPGGLPVLGDIVTLYDSDPSVVPVAITYNGGVNPLLVSSWDLFSVVIDGHLLVNGTVGADKINVNELFAQNAIVSGQLQVGTGSTFTIIDGNTGGLSSYVGGTTIFSATPSGGYLNGSAIGAGSINQSSLSPELQQWISEVGSGTTFEFGGSDSITGTSLTSTTYTLNSINFAAGPINVNFSYGGNNKTVISATQPTSGWVTLQLKRAGVNLGSPVTFTGTVTGLGTNEWYCTMPSISWSPSPSVAQGAAQIGVQITVVMPTGWSVPSLGAFTFGVFQEPSGAGVANMNLNDLQDVTITSATNGQVLTFENGTWINKNASGSATSVLNGQIVATTGGVRIHRASGTSASYVLFKDSGDSISGGNGAIGIDVGGSQKVSVSGTEVSISGGFTVVGLGDQIATFNRSGAGWSYIGFAQNGVRKSYIGVDGAGGSIWGSDTGSLNIIGTLANNGYQVLNSSNYNTYAPTKTGIGASGDWGINAAGLSANGTVVSMLSTGIMVDSPAAFGYVYLNSPSDWIAGGGGYVDINQAGNQIAKFSSSSGVTINRNTSVAGNITSSGTVSGTDCIATSDIRVKDNLVRIDKPIERLKKLNGGYTFNRSDMGNIRHAGVIANYVKEALPEAIFTDSRTDLLTVSHSGMLGLLVEVCTEQQRRIEELERRLSGDH